MKLLLAAVLTLLCVAAFRSGTAHGRGRRVHRRPDRCPAARRSHDDSGCRGPHGGQPAPRATSRFQTSREGDYEISAELSGFEPAASCRARAGGRTGHRVLHLARRHRGRNDRHGRQGWASATCKPFPWRSPPSRTPSSRASAPQTLGEAAALAPSVTFSQNTGFGQLTIRGIGANVLYAGSDPSSAMYLDGVYLARPAMEFVQFLDLDRIEVLRGPQGTLYGRNAVGGAMNLISRPPTNDFQASADFTAGNFGRASRRRADQRAAQTRPSDGVCRVHARRPRRLRPRPRASGPSAWRR